MHDSEYRVWSVGGTATPGVKEIAELGNCDILEQEIEQCEAAGSCCNEGYFSWECESPTGNSTVCIFSGNVTVSETYSRISMLSMIAPSPDWNVGLDSVDLCRRG